MMIDTQELLANFVKNGSESAFRELVTRYLDLVYSTAVRLVDGDTHRAQDVSQVVFADLARMAAKLSGNTMLGGWLHRHTCFVARTMMRGERRRQARERQAAEMNAQDDQTEGVLAQIAPILDEAIQELGPDDRDAILLRFFERRNLRSVGEALGTNENVAQKRVSRAVQELGILLQRRGVALSAAALASSLTAGAVSAAPPGLALSIAGTGLASAGGTASTGLTSTKVAVTAKLKFVIVGAIVVAGVVTVIILQNRFAVPWREVNGLPPQQPTEAGPADPGTTMPAGQQTGVSAPSGQSRKPRIDETQDSTPGAALAAQPEDQPTARPGNVTAENLAFPIQRYLSRSGGRIRIKGSSNIHDWQVEGSLIGGSLDVGTGFPAEPGQTFQPGLVQAQAEVFIPVRSLKSVDTDGRPYSTLMDQKMYESLRETQNPRIRYRLVEMSFKGATNYGNVLQFELESHGELVIAGITNRVTMPVYVLPLGDGVLRISGSISLKMTAFQINPPAPTIPLGMIKTGDDVSLEFDWVVAPRNNSAVQTQNDLVPLILKLPDPAFKGTPIDLQIGPNVEPLSDKPRPPMMIPSDVIAIATGSKITSSDTNASADALARITDGDKNASDRSIIFLRKGTQWVQMDLGGPQEIFALVIWHAHNAAKVYHDVIVQTANDAEFIENVRILFNNDNDNSSGLGVGTDREYFETCEGKLIDAKGVNARYIRYYSRGSTESALNEYTEIEVYGRRTH